MSNPGVNLERLVYAALIAWPARTAQGAIEADALKPLRQHFLGHVRTLFPAEAASISDTDLAAATVDALQQAAGYRDWWHGVLAASDLRFDFADREPRVSVDHAEIWESLLDHLDADALVTRALATQREGADGEQDVRALTGWSATVRIGDRGLEALWRRGLSDMHVHIGGARFAQAVWFDLMDEPARTAYYQGLLEFAGLSLVDVAMAAAARLRLWGDRERPTEDLPFVDEDGARWRWDARRLLGERLLLRNAWSKAVDTQFVLDLDSYLAVKLRFLRAARQPALDPHLGLKAFDDGYFRVLKRSEGLGARYASSPRLLHQPFGDALVFLLESQNLRKLELRTAPFVQAANYGQFAAQMKDILAKIVARPQCADMDIDVRVAIHFKRSRKASSEQRSKLLEEPGERGPLRPLRELLKGTDRDAAELAKALADEDLQQHMRDCFSRIDVAGQERDTPAWVFAPYLRLVRGDDETLADLKEMTAADPRAAEFACWLELANDERHRPHLGAPRLGMTVHAGEDYADPLDGLHQIACAKDLFGLGPGDGIGHALAMACDVPSFSRHRRVWSLISRGAALDSLVWLFDLISRQDHLGEFRDRLPDLRNMIEALAAEIYGGRRPHLVEDLIWLREARVRPRTPTPKNTVPRRLWLFKLDASAAVRAARDRLGPPDPARQRLDPVVTWAQGKVMDDVKLRRIVVEMNPSSNLRISGSRTLADSPTVRMVQEIDRGLLASVNTDNPGIFLTRVENEYALLLAGLRQAGVAEGEARELLEKARMIGLTETWWPDRGPGPRRAADGDVPSPR